MNVYIDPVELELFALELKIFVQLKEKDIQLLIRQLDKLSTTSKDNEFARFEHDFRDTMRYLKNYLAEIYQHHLFLLRKAKSIRSYLKQPTIQNTSINNCSSQSYSNNDSSNDKNTKPEKWIEKGIQSVDLSQLPEVEGVNGPDDFHKVSMEDMEKGLKKLDFIINVINQGMGTVSSYWANIDAQKKLSYANGYQRVYEAFYGNEPIRIEKDGNNYSITNGRHRIWLANKMGINSLPASIVEKQGEIVDNNSSQVNSSLKISGFNQLEKDRQKSVETFINSRIPKQHTAKISSIEYINKEFTKTTNKGVERSYGKWILNKKNDEIKLQIYKRDETSELSIENSIAHEIGHNVYENLDSKKQKEWATLHKSGNDFFGQFHIAAQSPEEDFAESYNYFINQSVNMIKQMTVQNIEQINLFKNKYRLVSIINKAVWRNNNLLQKKYDFLQNEVFFKI